jgi:hypothetical protein
MITEERSTRRPWVRGAVIGAWAVTVLWLCSDAGFNITAFLLAEFGGLLLLGWWLGGLVWWLARRRRRLPVGAPLSTRRNVIRWIWEPVTILTCFAIAYTGVLFPVRFALSRPALDRYASQLRDRGDSTPPAGARVHLFRVREVELRPNGVVRLITTSCMFDDCGVAYSPAGPPPVIGEDSYRHLSGNWWHWFRSW